YLVAPFNAMILDESIDRGQVVGPTSRVATLIGTDEVWVTVSIPVEQLPSVVLPDDEVSGSRARVEQRLGGTTSVVRSGSVARLLGQLDPQTRTAQLLVAVPNPLEGHDEAHGAPIVPLLPGAYVDVVLEGRVLEEVFRVPRTAVEEGNKVWVVETEGTLASRRVRVGWRDASDVVVTEGLDEGTHLVVSPLALPIEGMPVQARLLPHRSATSTGDQEQ
ncbi:MAG: HlyD family efflux transporter periplasmic adaptor subunit, partial [Myxococcota bacterium]